jgi:hypothetical protein
MTFPRGIRSRHAVGGLLAAVVVGLSVAPTAIGARFEADARPSASSVEPKPKPVRAVSPPVNVGVALSRTQDARYVVLNETTQSGRAEYEVDTRHARAEIWAGGKVSLIQIGKSVYAPKSGGTCDVTAQRSSVLLPNVAGMLLPSGIGTLHYTRTGRTIRWSIKTAGRYQPHGSVRINSAGKIVSAIVYSGPGVPLTATVSYPARLPRIAAPKNLCRK